jgi:hypothetical protein
MLLGPASSSATRSEGRGSAPSGLPHLAATRAGHGLRLDQVASIGLESQNLTVNVEPKGDGMH